MLLSDVFDARHIKLNLESVTKDEAFEELTETVIALHPELNRIETLESIITRENQMNTAVMPDVALPHGYCRTFNGIVGVIGVSQVGVSYETEQAVHCIFMTLMGGEAERENHLRVLSGILNLCNSRAFSEITAAQSGQEIYDILRRFDRIYTGRSL